MSVLQDKINDLEKEMYFFNTGKHTSAYKFLGCHSESQDGIQGYRFSVWAPNAHNVMLQGDFSRWESIQMMSLQGGLWTVFVQNAQKGHCYKYAIDNGLGHITYKKDPFAFKFEIAPKDASIVWDMPQEEWSDNKWLQSRAKRNWYESPIQIYEVHAGSWKIHLDGTPYTFDDLIANLIPYVKEMGYTHIEFMPLADHPLDASWGYQLTGYYAICGRYGTLQEFKRFVEAAHAQNIGVIMDWVPGHFCRNADALAYYDGTPTFEYQDYNRANNVGWGTLNFDLGKTQVQSFLISNAMFWLKEFHLDGIRVDAVSNMLYLDFDQGTWTPNEDGTNENKQGVAFLKQLNDTVHAHFPDVLMMAEESTNYPKITSPTSEGGLGFDYKWNMGWMNDSLKFFELDPIYRPPSLRLITFVFMYQYNERYVLPFSHDEVVHGKHSMLGKIKGTRQDQFKTLRLIHGYMMAQPGKTLHFMGNELGQFLEWRYYEELEWSNLTNEFNAEYQHFIKTLNHIGQEYKAFHELDHDPKGLTVLDADNLDEAVMTLIRHGKKKRDIVVVSLNFTPVERTAVRIGVPFKGQYELLLNSEWVEFGGDEALANIVFHTEEVKANHQPYSIVCDIPGLSVLFIKPKRVYGAK